MAFINSLLGAVVAPTGIWPKIIMAFNAQILNYAWAIIVMTLVIKLILSPLDFFNKKVTRKNSKMQAEMQPQIEVLKKKYGDNKEVLNQKTMELYKKNNVNMGGSCLFMLINMVLTLVIFITLFSGLNSMASYKVANQYDNIKTAYYNTELGGTSEERALQEYYNEKESFLWIKNVWLSDSAFVKSVPDYEKYANLVKIPKEERTEEAKTEYTTIMASIESENKTNGYFILVIISVLVSVGQQLLMNIRISKKKKTEQELLENKPKAPKQKQNIIMLIVLPLLMGYFALSYNAVFALYIITSGVFGLLTTPIINTIIDKVEAKEELKKQKQMAVSYGRKR